MRYLRQSLLVTLLLLVLGPAVPWAADWGGVTPGTSTQEDIRRLFGPPTQERSAKEDGYETREWIYEGAEAPAGLNKLRVEFGLLKPDGFKPNTVRTLALYPKENRFPVSAIQAGWGRTARVGLDPETGRPILQFDAGLVVFLDKEGRWAEEMYFVIPQQPRTQ